MAKLIFVGFLPNQEKPENFERFRVIASEIYESLPGEIKFSYIEKLQQFEITINTTLKSEIELKNMLGFNSAYLV